MKVKKGVLSLLAMICLLVVLQPMTALAAEESPVSSPVIVANRPLVVGTYYKTDESGAIVEGGSESDYNVYLSADGSKYILTLNNATIKGTEASGGARSEGIYYNGNVDSLPLEIVLEGESKNTVIAGLMPGGESVAIGVASQPLTISGSGKLNVHSDTYDAGNTKNDGSTAIFVSNSSLTINNGTITAIAKDAETYSRAIYAQEVTIAGGTLYVNCSLVDGAIVPMGGGANVDTSTSLH